MDKTMEAPAEPLKVISMIALRRGVDPALLDEETRVQTHLRLDVDTARDLLALSKLLRMPIGVMVAQLIRDRAVALGVASEPVVASALLAASDPWPAADDDNPLGALE